MPAWLAALGSVVLALALAGPAGAALTARPAVATIDVSPADVTSVLQAKGDPDPTPEPTPEPIPDPDPIPEEPPPQEPPPPPEPSSSPSPSPPSSPSPAPTSESSAPSQPAAPSAPVEQSPSSSAPPKKKDRPKPKRPKHREQAVAEEVLPAPVERDPLDPPAFGFDSGPVVVGTIAGALNPPRPASNQKNLVAVFLLGGIGLGVVLLGLAAVPTWAVRPVSAALLIEHWRVHLAATGLSAVFMALIVFLLGTSRI